jgi:hypothetical protein
MVTLVMAVANGRPMLAIWTPSAFDGGQLA